MSYQLIDTLATWQSCCQQLQTQPRFALDIEANSLYAYRERLCLIQISIPEQDFIVDPLLGLDLQPLGDLIENPAVEKVLHAAEYDQILLQREFGWQIRGLFDTMWAARILGHNRTGLAAILQAQFGVVLDKRYQKADWGKRPLLPAQLEYARNDTHYLLPLRHQLAQQLQDQGHWAEAQELFAEQTNFALQPASSDPDRFWKLVGSRRLTRPALSILRTLYLFREEEAQRQDRPPFKVIGDQTLLAIAQSLPPSLEAIEKIPGMGAAQTHRYGKRILSLIHQAQQSPPSLPQKSKKQIPLEIRERYDRLHNWRKERAQKRGVESDVILHRHTMWELAHANPQTPEQLAQIPSLGPWRQTAYGTELLALLEQKIKE